MAMPNAQYFGGMLSKMKLRVSGMKKPLASPPRNCIVMSIGKLAQYGMSNEITAKVIDAQMRTRRGPYAAPIHTAMRVTNIWATVCAVVIQAPSSKPAPTAPRMSARPKVDSRPFKVEMKVPSRTATSPSHGIEVGGDGIVGA